MFLDGFEDAEDVRSSFRAPEAAFEGLNIIVAQYTYEDYSGYAYVLFERGGKLFEVYGSHCSCYGLEDQWEEEETTVAAVWFGLGEDAEPTPKNQAIVRALEEMLEPAQVH